MVIDFLDMDSNKLVISEFYENNKAGKYDYTAVYQREKVWSEEKKSFLIDSILKNYPIPPVFFRMKIDQDTGLTLYDVIDGKQRLTTIIDFIEGKIVLPDDFGDDCIGNSELNGATFKDLDRFEKYKRQFWKYRIPVIFIDTDSDELINNVFDRLNRNGEPLVPQELRHAKYGDSKLYRDIEELMENNVWKEMFSKILETDRMEDKEFMSELLFLTLEHKIVSYTKNTLDELYTKWKDSITKSNIEKCEKIMEYIEDLKLDYKGFKINRVSHLYAIWGIAILALEQKIETEKLAKLLNAFYMNYRERRDCVGADDYKKSMSSDTKGQFSRKRRINALIMYCSANHVKIEMTL